MSEQGERLHVEGDSPRAPLGVQPRSRFGWLEGGFSRLIGMVTASLLLGIVVVISYQVVARYLPGMRVPRWTEEVSLILMVWLAMLGSGLGIRAGEHLSMDIALRQLGARAQRLVSKLIYLLVAGFGVYLVVYGYELASRTMMQTFAASKLPIGWMYLGIPFGGVLVTLYALRAIFVPPPTLELDAAAIPKRNRLLQGALLGMAVLLITGSVAVFGSSLWGPIGILLGSFVALLVAGVPIAVGVGIASLITALTLDLPPLIIAQRMANGVSSTPLLAIPFFILAGQIMAEGGIAKRLVDFARVLVGPIPGGLAMVNVVSSMLFGGASGSAVADVSANGTILIPMMKRQGYGGDFSTAITVASSVQGIIIPPSHNAVIYSLAAGGVSIGALFLGGYLPGIMIGLSLMVASFILSKRRGYPALPRPNVREGLRITLAAIPSLAVGFIIVGGIAFGFFTATEAAAIGAVTAFLVSTLIYRELSLRGLWHATLASVRTIAVVIFLIATASAFAWLMAYLRIPAALASGLLGLTDNPYALLLLINLLLLLLGAVMDMAPLILILTPVLLPIVTADPINMDPVHFGIVLLMNLGLGLTTPPVGSALFVGCAIGRVRLEEASRAMLYLWPALFIVLMLVTYFPWFVQVLPRLLGAA
jgi:tripartite ATP-independent transporter DctM subunit